MDPATAPTARFTSRVENYVKARPGYPAEIVSLLQRRCGLTPASTLIDVGCGTGLLARPFCEFGCSVIGIEPNAAMREAGRRYLAPYANFRMLDGQAESIPLPDATAGFITAGQAFHWFDAAAARREFIRILKPDGWAVLVWNNREFTGSQFADQYENLAVRFGVDYAEVHQRGKATSAAFDRFFGSSEIARESCPNPQQLDYEGFVARVLSASYMPGPEHANYASMMQEVDRIFRENQKDGVVWFRYTTRVIYGRMT
jgi:SAM-dependent methyltransferase